MPVKGDLVGTFRRELTVSPIEGADQAGKVYFRAAVGDIEETEDGFVVNGSIRIQIQSDGEPFLRSVDGKKEVLVPVKGTKIIQTIDW